MATYTSSRRRSDTTDASGSGDLGNEDYGVKCTNNADGNTIGGTTSVLANRIAFNDEDGIYVNTGEDNSLRGNVIFANGGLGIDLVPDGVTPNDPGDGDTLGGNNLQNYPVVSNSESLLRGPLPMTRLLSWPMSLRVTWTV